LDVQSRKEALEIVDELKEYAGCFKVGMQLFTAEGPDLVKAIIENNCKVFLDLKYHDIPNTVEKAVEEAAKLGVSYITIHLSGGSEMIKSAVRATEKFPKESRPLLLGVTVLTGISAIQLDSELEIKTDLSQHVNSLIQLGIKNGITGIVCSPSDLANFKNEFKNLFFVTPGIRPSWVEKNDQQRIETPSQAITNGSSMLVIGRPILNAIDKVDAAKKIILEVESCLK
jgi:orotidine-5'-phosphate decarboxylase